MSDWLIALLSVAIPVLLTGLFNIWLFRQQTQKEADKEKASIQKIMNEAWQMVNDELREEIDRYKGERKLLINKYQQLESDFDAARLEWQKKEAFYDATIAQQNEKILELQTELKKLKRTTDELESKTGPIPTQKRKPRDNSK